MKNEQLWYEHAVYRRYWRTYGQAMDWCHRHRAAYWRATARADRFEIEALRQATAGGQGCRRAVRQPSSPDDEGPVGLVSEREARRSELVCPSRARDSAGSTVAVEQLEMEITEDIIEFLEKSELHRAELRAKRVAEDQATARDFHESGAPKEQPGVRRTAEMKSLYGMRAPIIHGMETAVQLTFHRNCDHHRPKLWPNIALNLEFK